MAEEHTPTTAEIESAKRLLDEVSADESASYSELWLARREAEEASRLGNEWRSRAVAAEQALRDERAKRPDRGRMAFALFLHESGQDEAFLRRIWEGHPTEHPVKLNYYGLADAAISSLALEPEALDRAMQLNEQEEERG